MRSLLAALALSLLPACARPAAAPPAPEAPRPSLSALAATPAPGFAAARVEGVPHEKQRPDFCGEACVAMYAHKLGRALTQDDVFNASGLDPARGIGVTTRELAAALSRLGFAPGPVWYEARSEQATADLSERFAELYRDLASGVPSIVCMRYDESPTTTEHFRLILGYDPERDEVIYHEPAVADGAYRRMGRGRFLSLWPLFYSPDRWPVIRLRLAADQPREPPRFQGPSPADYMQRVRALKELAGPGFSVAIEPPFVVIGDGGPARVQGSASGTVRWSVERLRRDFFARDPADPPDIWLFRDDASYRGNALRLFGDKPTTPYGYFSPKHRALIMNIATGGGTLVHEIVHPYVHENLPDAPAWLNEGLGSLFEASTDNKGHIQGVVNWRLGGLQRAIARRRAVPLRALLATTDEQFYADETGLHYAEARYLFFYLQEHELLMPFWRRYLAERAQDRSGLRSLEATLGRPGLEGFDEPWQRWVMTLRQP